MSKKIRKIDQKDPNISKNRIIDDYPIFCFKYLQDSSLKECRDSKFFFDFLFRLKKLSELGWKQIGTSARHSYGFEKIPISQIKQQKPSFITDDVSELIVFRATGNNLPFLGLRNENKFHIIFIETNFGDIYDH